VLCSPWRWKQRLGHDRTIFCPVGFIAPIPLSHHDVLAKTIRAGRTCSIMVDTITFEVHRSDFGNSSQSL
jgi:hypothetical protein